LSYLFRQQADSKWPLLLFICLFVLSSLYGIICTLWLINAEKREEYLEQVIVNKAMVEGEKSKQESLVTSGEMLTVTKEQNIWTRTRPAYDAAMAEREMFKHIRKEKDANDMRLSDAIKSNQVPKQ
jgi:hypothetical protein